MSTRLGLRVLIKRDDLTGLALGGNKVRKLEFLIADAIECRADTIITTGGSQSNHARLTAAACRLTGLGCHLILDRGEHPEEQGNLLLDRLFGAEIRLIDSSDPDVAAAEMERLSSALEAKGKRTYVIPRGGSVPVGAAGYAAFVPELLGQLNEREIAATRIFLGTGSTGTHSGVLAGLTAAASDIQLHGISVSRPAELQVPKVAALASSTLEHLGLHPLINAASVHVDDRFRGPGYGIPTDETMDAIQIAALDEALVLDPVYTGKAMAGLIGQAKEGSLGSSDVVVFVHTGGAPALFAYGAETAASLPS